MKQFPLRVWLFVFFVAAFGLGGKQASAQSQPSDTSSCKLRSSDGRIKHVIQIIFDNVHLHRDNPYVQHMRISAVRSDRSMVLDAAAGKSNRAGRPQRSEDTKIPRCLMANLWNPSHSTPLRGRALGLLPISA